MEAEEALSRMAGQVAEDLGLELWEVQLERHGSRRKVTVFADKAGGITLDDLQALSRKFSGALDQDSPFDGPFDLDCASPGPERRLRHLDDVRRYLGTRAEITLKEPLSGRRRFTGRPSSVEGGLVVFEGEDGESFRFPWTDIDRAKLRL